MDDATEANNEAPSEVVDVPWADVVPVALKSESSLGGGEGGPSDPTDVVLTTGVTVLNESSPDLPIAMAHAGSESQQQTDQTEGPTVYEGVPTTRSTENNRGKKGAIVGFIFVFVIVVVIIVSVSNESPNQEWYDGGYNEVEEDFFDSYLPWLRIGEIKGERYENSGQLVSISEDGEVVTIGTPGYYTDEGITSGRIRVFKISGDEWAQLGTDIVGLADPGSSSMSLSPDGRFVAIGTISDNGLFYFRVYEHPEDGWIQKGDRIRIDSIDGFRDSSLSSDGTTFATVDQSGRVQVYEFETSWSQRSIIEPVFDSVAMALSISSNGSVLAISYSSHNNEKGLVRVYEWNTNGTLEQKGHDIIGDDEWGYFEPYLTLSPDASTLAIRFGYDGSIRVFKFGPNDTWVPQGSDGLLGYGAESVSFSSDGTIMAIGYPSGSTGFKVINGYVRIFEYVEGDWNQLGVVIGGERSYDSSGVSVSLSADGMRVAIGAPYSFGRYEDDEFYGGQVRIYEYNRTYDELYNY